MVQREVRVLVREVVKVTVEEVPSVMEADLEILSVCHVPVRTP